MSSASNSNLDRLHELLADQALQGLDDAAARELNSLLAAHPEVDADAYSRAAAMLDQAIVPDEDAEPMPESLRDSISQSASAWLIENDQANDDDNVQAPAVIGFVGWAPWLVAAASLAIAAFVWVNAPSTSSQPAPEVATAFERFIASNTADLIRVDWQAVAKNYPVPADEFSGEVVWSGASQEGFMVFEGLTPNDPDVEQFQLWIFDSTRGDSPPVDGGVFDVDSTGRVIIPIRAALAIGNAAAFAVTVEEPGGVVVSSQDRIATLASVEQG